MILAINFNIINKNLEIFLDRSFIKIMQYEYKPIVITKKNNFTTKEIYQEDLSKELNIHAKDGFRLISVVNLDGITPMNGTLLCVFEKEID